MERFSIQCHVTRVRVIDHQSQSGQKTLLQTTISSMYIERSQAKETRITGLVMIGFNLSYFRDPAQVL